MTLKEQTEAARRLIEAYVPKGEREEAEKRVVLDAFSAHENILIRESELIHLTASSWIVDPARKKALMVYHNIYDSWSWTGGHADGDGDLLAVAVREAKEETGADVRVLSEEPISLDLLTVQAHVKRGKYVPPHLHVSLCYLLEADESCALTIKPDENSGVCWIPFEEIERRVSEPDMRPIYKKLTERAQNAL